jgi:hypothetical protein
MCGVWLELNIDKKNRYKLIIKMADEGQKHGAYQRKERIWWTPEVGGRFHLEIVIPD